MSGRRGFCHHWIPLQLDRGMYKVMWDADYSGRVIVEEAAFAPAYGKKGEIQHFGTPKIEPVFLSGTRELKSARTTMMDSNGKPLVITSTPLRTVYLAAGTGYIPSDDWGHGHYKGKLVVQGKEYDMSTQAKRTPFAILNETLCRFDLSTGEVSYGMHENMCLGVFQPYGSRRATRWRREPIWTGCGPQAGRGDPGPRPQRGTSPPSIENVAPVTKLEASLPR